jgi:hypothetical protein
VITVIKLQIENADNILSTWLNDCDLLKEDHVP